MAIWRTNKERFHRSHLGLCRPPLDSIELPTSDRRPRVPSASRPWCVDAITSSTLLRPQTRRQCVAFRVNAVVVSRVSYTLHRWLFQWCAIFYYWLINHHTPRHVVLHLYHSPKLSPQSADKPFWKSFFISPYKITNNVYQNLINLWLNYIYNDNFNIYIVW